MKKILVVLMSLLSGIVFSQDRKGAFRLATAESNHELYVTFGSKIDVEKSSVLQSLESQYAFTFEKLRLIPDDKIAQMQNISDAKNGNSDALIRIANTYKVNIQDATNAKLLELAAKLEAVETVSYCSLISLNAIPPPSDIPPATPNYESAQTYIGANPGVNMQFAWDSGLTGTGIRIRDVEYGFNKNHEEFNDLTGAFIQPGMTISTDATPSYSEHGTAVFGIVFADHGNYGISGMAHGAQEMVLFPEWQQSGYNRVLAVSESIGASVAGDIIIYEMQAYGVNDAFVPAEYENLIWDLTKAATDAGIIIVAAAGNGNANLDSTPYMPYMNRGDSGAIIVGGGLPDLSHSKISYSTYGNRVNMQGWASNVRSSGYGDFAAIFGDFNQRYTNFSGTSSATPIVASCAIVLQSYYHSQTGNYLTPSQMRNILVTTGIAQGTGGHIGPLPNMEPAIAAVTALATQKFDAFSFFVYPNPANDVISIAGDVSSEARVEIANSIGQIVYAGFASDKNIPVSSLTSGIYFVKVMESGSSVVRKIVKR